MICMKPKCCMDCDINSECPVCCGFNDEEMCNDRGIYAIEEYEHVYCSCCSFRDCKKQLDV